MTIVDADGHVAEGSALPLEAMRRWPQFVAARSDGKPGLTVEGRHHPEDSGPGAGCPPQHGLSVVEGIDWSSAAGMLRDADRDHIDTMVLYPSFGLCAPSLEDPTIRPAIVSSSRRSSGTQRGPRFSGDRFSSSTPRDGSPIHATATVTGSTRRRCRASTSSSSGC